MDWKNILKQQKPCIPVLVPGVTHFKVRALVSNANFVCDHVYNIIIYIYIYIYYIYIYIKYYYNNLLQLYNNTKF